jgi:hypothetical protein
MEHELHQRLILFTLSAAASLEVAETWAKCTEGQVNRIVVDGWLGSC